MNKERYEQFAQAERSIAEQLAPHSGRTRNIAIMKARLLPKPNRPTLLMLSKKYGLCRERIRQIDANATRRFHSHFFERFVMRPKEPEESVRDYHIAYYPERDAHWEAIEAKWPAWHAELTEYSNTWRFRNGTNT